MTNRIKNVLFTTLLVIFVAIVFASIASAKVGPIIYLSPTVGCQSYGVDDFDRVVSIVLSKVKTMHRYEEGYRGKKLFIKADLKSGISGEYVFDDGLLCFSMDVQEEGRGS